MSLEPLVAVSLHRNGRRVVDAQVAAILDGVDREGSISAAARALGLSYAHVWNTLAEVEGVLGLRVVEPSRGGRRGGGATLTHDGRDILRQYTRLLGRAAKSVGAREAFPERRVKRRLTEAPVDLRFVGSECPGAELLLHLMQRRHAGLRYSHLWVGSMAGVTAVALGEAELTGIHILDTHTGSYNTSFLASSLMGTSLALIRGFTRSQGLITAQRAAKQIHGLGDLLRGDTRFVNRPPGSGTRILLDHELQKLAAQRNMSLADLVGRISGYGREARSHSEAAELIQRGEADVALGLETVAVRNNLHFIPVAVEQYDFLSEKRKLTSRYIPDIISLLKSSSFHGELQRKCPGIRPTNDIGRVLFV